jgi:ArsR family transcriptional regulator
MELDFTKGAAIFKALSDENRIRIIHILSCGERCGCELQQYFDLTQPTLSHHLNLLVSSGLVEARPEGKWVHYRLAKAAFNGLEIFISQLSRETVDCQCKKRPETSRPDKE